MTSSPTLLTRGLLAVVLAATAASCDGDVCAVPTDDELPVDRDVAVIFYCYNEQCGASHQAATAATAKGWSNVARMPAGIVGWQAAGLAVER